MNNPFTKRETVILIILPVFAVIFAITVKLLDLNMLVVNAWMHAHEPQFLLILLFTLGPYIALDPGRRAK